MVKLEPENPGGLDVGKSRKVSECVFQAIPGHKIQIIFFLLDGSEINLRRVKASNQTIFSFKV